MAYSRPRPGATRGHAPQDRALRAGARLPSARSKLQARVVRRRLNFLPSQGYPLIYPSHSQVCLIPPVNVFVAAFLNCPRQCMLLELYLQNGRMFIIYPQQSHRSLRLVAGLHSACAEGEAPLHVGEAVAAGFACVSVKGFRDLRTCTAPELVSMTV